MQFDLRTPCKECPFTRSCMKGWLGARRMRQILRSLDNDFSVFACHKFLYREDFNEEEGRYEASDDQQACAGAVIYQEQHGLRAVLTRLAMRDGRFNPFRMRGSDRVFETEAEAIRHHSNSKDGGAHGQPET